MDDHQVSQLMSALGVPLYALGAALFFTLMRRPWKRGKRYIDQGGSAQGVVVGHIAAGSPESGKSLYALEVEFHDRAGRAFRIVSMGATSSPLPVGTPLAVAYDVNDPNQAVIMSSARTVAFVGTCMAALFGLLAAACAVVFVVLLL
jgi:hypothetical protein